MGTAADSWQVWTDKFLTEDDDNEKQHLKEKILELIDIYYDALDAPKTGKKVTIFATFLGQHALNFKMLRSFNISLPPLPLLKQVRVPNHLKADRYPHYMEKVNEYHSCSVLGKICDAVEKYKTKSMSRYGEFYLLINYIISCDHVFKFQDRLITCIKWLISLQSQEKKCKYTHENVYARTFIW